MTILRQDRSFVWIGSLTGERRRRGNGWLVGDDRSKGLRREEGLRLGVFGELLGRREAVDRRRQHGVRIGVAIGRAIEFRQRQRGAQFEAARFLRPLSEEGA